MLISPRVTRMIFLFRSGRYVSFRLYVYNGNTYAFLALQSKEKDMDGVERYKDTCSKPRLFCRRIQVIHVGFEIYWPYRLG